MIKTLLVDTFVSCHRCRGVGPEVSGLGRGGLNKGLGLSPEGIHSLGKRVS